MLIHSIAARSNAGTWIGNTILLAWLIYLLVAPTIGFGWIESWHNEQRAVQIVLLAFTAVAYCVIGMLTRSEESVARWRLPTLLLVFLALGLMSALRAQFVLAALAEVSMFALLAILAMLTARVVSTDVVLYVRWARWFALLFATAYVLGVATRYLAAVNLEQAIDLDVLILGYANPRFPSALHAVLIPFLALSVLEKTELRSLRVGAAVVLSLIWAINLGLGTRGIWFAYAIGIPATAALVGWRHVARPLTVLTLTAVAGLGLYYWLFSMAPALMGTGARLQAPTDNLTLTSREVLWELSWQAIKSSPWLGIGPLQFAALGSRVGAHPHNWPLQIAAEWGLPALGLLAFALFRLGNAIRRATIRDYRLVALTMAVAVALLLGLVDGNLAMPVSQIGAVLVLGILMGALHSREQREREQGRTSHAMLVLTAFAGAVACGTVIAFSATSLLDQPRSIETFRRAQPGAWLVPRFWEQGNLY